MDGRTDTTIVTGATCA